MNVSYFLGANSGAGFFSLYDGFCRADGDFLHLIKAGPGGGKSGFMRRIAEAASAHGYDTECVLCSGDPDSLDAVYIPEKHIGFVDATAPHVCEPLHFGFDSDYVNLGRFCAPASDERIPRLTEKYRAMYKTAYSYLVAAKSVQEAELYGAKGADTLEKVRERARGTAVRRLKSSGGNGTETKRFIRCISCKGEMTLEEDMQKLCKRIYLVDDRMELADAYLAELLKCARDFGTDTIVCPSPLCPERLDALVFPQAGLCFAAAPVMPDVPGARHVRLDALVPPDVSRTLRPALREKEKLSRELLAQAVHWLGKAKEYHDELELAYKPHVDFAALDKFTDDYISRLFG